MTNNFLPFGAAGGSNVISQAEFAALPARLTGFVAGVALSTQLNKVWRQSSFMAAVIGEFIQDFGGLDALDDGDLDAMVLNLARAFQRGTFSFADATGTANSWVVNPTPAVAVYAAGRPLYIKAPATNTSATVVANISGLGTRPIKKADGSNPAIGDLVIGQRYLTVDDGTNIQILTPLKSDIKPIVDPTNLVVSVFDTSGTWVVPANVRFILAECWGAGGGGGAGDGSSLGGLGGGGGLYAGAYLAVTPGASHTVTIGAGGSTNTSPGNAGAGGGTTSLGSLLSAAGGGGGGPAGGSPGAGGTSSAGAQFTVPGGGAFISFGANGSPGGNGGVGAQGGQQGNNGQRPGGGAAGNSVTNPYVGQTGGAGRVKITYAAP